MNEPIEITYTSGATVYARLWQGNSSLLLDFADYTWKPISTDFYMATRRRSLAKPARAVARTATLIPGTEIIVPRSRRYTKPVYQSRLRTLIPRSPMTDVLTLTERAGSATMSRYTGALDLSQIAPGLDLIQGSLIFYKRTGSVPSLYADLEIAGPLGVEAQLGLLGRRQITVKASVALRTTGGQSMHVWVELLADGQRVPLHDLDPDATCEVDVWIHGNSPLFSMDTSDMGAVNAEHRFESSYSNPNPTADSLHAVSARITALGQTFVLEGKDAVEGDHTFYAFP